MRIAIIGSGISGLVCAWLLYRQHDITVYEANDYIGGHTHTHDVSLNGKDYSVDSGFIVFNRRNYPNFSKVLDTLGVDSQPTSMSFSVHCERSGLEYNGTSLNRLFAQRRNLLRPSFYRMIADIVRFNRDSPRLLHNGRDEQTLTEYVREHGYSHQFRDHYLVPMCAALWSAPPQTVASFPIKFLVRFFQNHGMLAIRDSERPEWRVVRNGSASYVRAMTAGFRDRFRLATPVIKIRRQTDGVTVHDMHGDSSHYDAVILACHSDEALGLLDDPSPTEREVLSALPYQDNEAVLHTDDQVLPRRRLAWASWNYRIPARPGEHAAVTYYMNSLQGLESAQPLCVTLNQTDSIRSDRILRKLRYRHPLFTTAAIAAQARRRQISGVNNTWYCGAYWGNGFHEDGVNSALAVCDDFGVRL